MNPAYQTSPVKGVEKPMSVVIIGGSLAGLIHGIMIKRLGHNVRILDQTRSSARTDQAAGMGTGPQGLEFLKQHDLDARPYAFACPGFQMLDKQAKIKRILNRPLNLTSWNVLYYRLRANFDSFRSNFCPEPPTKSEEEEGKAVYDLGKRVTNVIHNDGLITVEFDNLLSGGGGVVHADFVVVADGVFSTIRQRLLPDSQHHYSGYVAWRGTVPEQEVLEATRNLFDNPFNVFAMGTGYIIGYAMPGENGSLEKGKRLLNWVWYFNCPKNTPDYNDNMTDIDGHKHRSTLPIGKMRPEIWAKQKIHASEVLNTPFLELVNKTAEPFISTVNVCAAIKATFCDGKVVLVGEALTLLRLHTGMSFNHAAVDCLHLEKVLKGSISMAQWEKAVLQYAEKTKLLSICIGTYYQSGILNSTFVLSVVKYLMAFLRQALVNSW